MTRARDPATAPPRAPVDQAVAPATDTSTPRHWSAGHVIIAVVIALVVGTLFNAQSLLATAERQPFGWQRNVAVALAQPVADLSAALWLDRPRHAFDVALGRGPAAAEAAPEQDAPPAAAPVTPQPTAEPAPEITSAAEPTTSATPTPAPPAGPMGLDRGPVTADDPLRIYIGGDSMVEIQFGMALEDLADDTGMIETLTVDFDRGSGLSRPDFVDWPARLADVSENLAPDVMVVYFGGNDAQPLEIDGGVHEPEDDIWQDEYRSRVAALMDQLAADGHHVYWMGLPIPRSEVMVTRFTILNDIYESEAAGRDAITFVPMWDLFAGPDGTYSEYLPDREGVERDMRLDDGIHLTTAGAYRAARPTIARIMEDFEIPEP